MAKTISSKGKYFNVKAVCKTKIKTTYEYVPIIGEILGFWRKQRIDRFENDICLYLNHEIYDYDHLYINGKEIKIPKELKKKDAQ